jgi:hypothetical protein
VVGFSSGVGRSGSLVVGLSLVSALCRSRLMCTRAARAEPGELTGTGDMRTVRWALLAAMGASLLAGCASSSTSSSHASLVAPIPTVPCSDSIGPAASGTAGHYRVILGAVSVPPRFVAQAAVATPGQTWPYWDKAGIAVRLGRIPATVSVPPEWRAKVAITWGNGSVGIVSSLRFVRCRSTLPEWQAYVGGFFIRSRTECVPLEIRVGSRRQVVHFGIGRACGRDRRR